MASSALAKAGMKYNMFPDEETCKALASMRTYYTELGTTPSQVFKDIDEKGEGSLTYWNFYKGFKNKGFKFEQKVAEKLMALLDQKSTGRVELREFEKVFGHLEYKQKKTAQVEAKTNPPKNVWNELVDALGRKRDRITDQIQALDTDKSGSLSYWEFSQGLKKLGIKLERHQVEVLLSSLDKDGDGEVSIGEFVSGVLAQIEKREGGEVDATRRRLLAEEREKLREEERVEFEQQQKDALSATNLTAYEVRAAWNKVNRAISKKGKQYMTKLFYEFDTDGGGTVDRGEFREGLKKLGVKLSGSEFEACWQYADPRGEGELTMEYFVNGLGEIDPEVDEQAKAHSQKDLVAKRSSLATLSSMGSNGDNRGSLANACGEDGEATPVELHDAWLALCKYFGKGKARALATFKQIDTDQGGTLDQSEFRVFIAMLNLKLSDEELEALWSELDESGNGSVTFLELQTAVNNKERKAAEDKSSRDAAKVRAEKAMTESSKVSSEVLRTADAWDSLHEFLERNGAEASKQFFLSFDSTGHGTLSREEFRNALLAGPKLDLDEEVFETVWLDIDLTGHNEIEFEEIETNVNENKDKADQVIAGSWLPSAKDKQKELIKKETVKRKEKEAQDFVANEKKEARKAVLEAKRGKLAKASGNQQIKLKALQMLRRRSALAKAKEKSKEGGADLGKIPYERLRQVAMLCVGLAVVQLYLALRVQYKLEGTGQWALAANGCLVVTALWAVVLSLSQHWFAMFTFFGGCLASLCLISLNLLSNVNTFVFLDQVADECYSPSEVAPALNYCYDDEGQGGGKSQAACVCTDKATQQCFEFVPGVDASGCDPQDASGDLLSAACGAVATFLGCCVLWSLVGCFGPLYTQTVGYYYLFVARHKYRLSLAAQSKQLNTNRSAAMKEYNKKRKEKKAKSGLEALVAALNKHIDEGGGTLGVFKRMDAQGLGSLEQLGFRGGLQTLGIKASAADVNKVWGFMDSDHSGSITFADFAAGLKLANKSLAGAGVGLDLEAGAVEAEEMDPEVAAQLELEQGAWNKCHDSMQRLGLGSTQFFDAKIDENGRGDLDQSDFEEGFISLGLALSNEEVVALWNCTVVPPSDLVNSDDFALACEKHPPA